MGATLLPVPSMARLFYLHTLSSSSITPPAPAPGSSPRCLPRASPTSCEEHRTSQGTGPGPQRLATWKTWLNAQTRHRPNGKDRRTGALTPSKLRGT